MTRRADAEQLVLLWSSYLRHFGRFHRCKPPLALQELVRPRHKQLSLEELILRVVGDVVCPRRARPEDKRRVTSHFNLQRICPGLQNDRQRAPVPPAVLTGDSRVVATSYESPVCRRDQNAPGPDPDVGNCGIFQKLSCTRELLDEHALDQYCPRVAALDQRPVLNNEGRIVAHAGLGEHPELERVPVRM